jgi:hypothetical protein
MAATPDPATIRKANFKAFETWVKSYGKTITPDGEVAIFYAGDFINMGELGKAAKAIEKADSGDPHMGKIWAYVKNMTDNPILKRAKGRKPRYASIDTALAACKVKPPVVFDPQTAAKVTKYTNIKDYAYGMGGTKGDGAFFLEADRKKLWSILSDCYAENTKGEVMILAEFSRDMASFKKNSDLVHTELKRLLQNKALPAAATRQVVAYVNRYIDAYGDKTKDMLRLIAEAEAELAKKPKGS